MPYFKFKENKIFYKIKGKREPVLLLHGNSLSSRMFSTLFKSYSKHFQAIVLDFPGHGKSGRIGNFEVDFWYYNSMVVHALINELKLDKVSVIGTSGGALVAINLALEHPDRINYLVADSFEGENPLSSYIKSIRIDRERDKRKLLARLIWFYCHGSDWRKVVDFDTEVNVEFSKTGRSFFHKSISDLQVPTLLTGSREDEYCDHLEAVYELLKAKNSTLLIHLFEKGKHPAMLSNRKEFLRIVSARINGPNKS